MHGATIKINITVDSNVMLLDHFGNVVTESSEECHKLGLLAYVIEFRKSHLSNTQNLQVRSRIR
jgi:S-adenosylmethionine hydrolase